MDRAAPHSRFGRENVGADGTTGTGACFNAKCTNPGVWGGTPANDSYWTHLPDGYLRMLWGNFKLDLHAENYKRADPAVGYVGYNQPGEFEVNQFLSADIRHRWAISSTATLRSRLYGDTYTYLEQLPDFYTFQCPSGFTTCNYHGTGYSRWVGLEEQLSIDWLHDQSLTTMIGVDGRATRVGESNTEDGIVQFGSSAPAFGVFDKSEYLVAGYGQQTWRPLHWLFLNVGARVDGDFRVDDDVQYSHFSPRAVAAVNPWHNATLKVIYSEAFRAPSYFETNYTDNQTAIPNLTLKPETVESGEVSFEQRIGTQRFFVGGFERAVLVWSAQLGGAANGPRCRGQERHSAGACPPGHDQWHVRRAVGLRSDPVSEPGEHIGYRRERCVRGDPPSSRPAVRGELHRRRLPQYPAQPEPCPARRVSDERPELHSPHHGHAHRLRERSHLVRPPGGLARRRGRRLVHGPPTYQRSFQQRLAARALCAPRR